MPVSNYANMKRLILQNLSIIAIKCARFHVKAAGFDFTRSEVSRRAVYLFTNTRTGDPEKLSPRCGFLCRVITGSDAVKLNS